MVSDSSNAILWDSCSGDTPWKFCYILNKIRALSSLIMVKSKHIIRSANDLTYSLAKGIEIDLLSVLVI